MAKRKIVRTIKQTNKANKVVTNPFSTKGSSRNTQSGKIIVHRRG